jgi:hypothetical protein
MHGTPFSGVAEKVSPEVRKRKRESQQDTDESKRPWVFAETSSPDQKIKSEPEDFSDSSEGDDSEDEMPLAKRRHDRVKTGDASFKGSSMAIRHGGFSTGLHGWQDNHPLEPNGQLKSSQNRPKIHKEYIKNTSKQ